jgi:hypothetical protein
VIFFADRKISLLLREILLSSVRRSYRCILLLAYLLFNTAYFFGSFWPQIIGRWLLAATEEENSVKLVLTELLSEESVMFINSLLFF